MAQQAILEEMEDESDEDEGAAPAVDPHQANMSEASRAYHVTWNVVNASRQSTFSGHGFQNRYKFYYLGGMV